MLVVGAALRRSKPSLWAGEIATAFDDLSSPAPDPHTSVLHAAASLGSLKQGGGATEEGRCQPMLVGKQYPDDFGCLLESRGCAREGSDGSTPFLAEGGRTVKLLYLHVVLLHERVFRRSGAAARAG